jgi:hypothetical protein
VPGEHGVDVEFLERATLVGEFDLGHGLEAQEPRCVSARRASRPHPTTTSTPASRRAAASPSIS